MRRIPDTARHGRVIITALHPSVDGGRWPARRIVGDTVNVMACVIADGHDRLAVELQVKRPDGKRRRKRLALRWNDEYLGTFDGDLVGTYAFRVAAWVDRFATWQDEFWRRVQHHAPAKELIPALLDGAELIRETAATARYNKRLLGFARALEGGKVPMALDTSLRALMRNNDLRQGAVHSPWQEVAVDGPLAGFAAWYEFFPRSASANGHHGTLDDAANRLARIRKMGFDIVYLPPIHPIGTTARKGKDNSPAAGPHDPGSPWAIGSAEGGHTAVHAALGGLAAFDRFMACATEVGLKVALDIAFQCSPDHPYVREHPDWFKRRADGTIRYAENPPKKYEDVYPLDFTTADYVALWKELKRVFEFWIDRGVTVFRVDNPHTKSFAFWQWCLASLRKRHADLIFLAEAFTRPKTMYTLAKLGFNNSYTYFTWRNTKDELRSYTEELAHTEVAEFFRPNFWPNTPDILPPYLVSGGRPAHMVRFILAATLVPTYGVYGPPFEHVCNKPHPDREEYADNEKYEVRSWDWQDDASLQPLFMRINAIRRAHPALQQLRSVRFFAVCNDQILGYAKKNGASRVLCFVNLDPHHEQAGDVVLPMDFLELETDARFIVQDLLGEGYRTWQGAHHHIRLNPHVMPAAVYSIESNPAP